MYDSCTPKPCFTMSVSILFHTQGHKHACNRAVTTND
ncbi:unnamed protein product [Callosobruchus maculatus]|uniref:Uncharacterized protein n=1 Tax=Callosobruchus maculatus TaxID=64391 RepID=A0A653DQ46_CALMS|nr:unnamed protein product [Callosobruchus maculatus]